MQRLNPLQCSYVKSIQIDLDRRPNYVMFRQEGPFQRLVNQRVVDTTIVEGWAHPRWGADGMMRVAAMLWGLLMSLNMLIESPADCRGWLKATGFRKTSVLPLTEAELILIVMATKYQR